MNAPSDAHRLIEIFGTDEAVPEQQSLSAGKLSVRIADGQIKSVRWDEKEILRGVSYLLRDANWATPRAMCTVTLGAETGEIASATITGMIESGAIHFKYTISIEAEARGVLKIATEGEALSAFAANRIGLTVLHPVPACCGLNLAVAHTNGTEIVTQFPLSISPSQPVFDIRALSYSLPGAETIEMLFFSVRPDGSDQCFEMEDQRNWGDASYKTYVGSLLDPWPFPVEAGDLFTQEIAILIKAPAGQSASAQIQAQGGASAGRFKVPAIGLSVPLDGAAEALANIRRYGAFRPDYISAYLRSDVIKPDELEALRAIVETLGCRLAVELEAHNDPADALASVADQLRQVGLRPHSLLACPAPYLKSYQPDAQWPDVMPLDAFYGLARQHFPGVRIGGGMLSFFTEMNRKWPPAGAIDYVAHAYSPIIHAADDETVLQNLESLPFMAKTVADQLPGVPYEIISARISMRQNPYGAAPQPNPNARRIAMAVSDPRESAQFGGLWMLELVEILAGTQAEAVCLGALSGHASIYAPERPDGKLPSYFALEALAGAAGLSKEAFREMKNHVVEKHFKDAQTAFQEARR